MTREVTILIVEDEPEVREAMTRDIEPFAEHFRIEAAEDAAEARELVTEIEAAGDRLGLVLCDHLLPGERGVDFLIALNRHPPTSATRKVLITGQAGQEDTIRAVNEASLDHYIAKPWQPEELRGVVRDQLTSFVIDDVEDLLPYVSVLDGPRLLEAVAARRLEE